MINILQSIENIIAASNAVTVSQLGTDGQAVVADAVSAAEDIGGSGETKFSAALAKAGTDLLALGKDVSLYVLHLAIESAVTALNAPQVSQAVIASQAVSITPMVPASSPSTIEAPVAVVASVTDSPVPNGQALSNAIANVVDGSTVETEGATLVIELAGQGVTVTLGQAEDAITAGLPSPAKLNANT